jgi:hypothetical protein
VDGCRSAPDSLSSYEWAVDAVVVATAVCEDAANIKSCEERGPITHRLQLAASCWHNTKFEEEDSDFHPLTDGEGAEGCVIYS